MQDQHLEQILRENGIYDVLFDAYRLVDTESNTINELKNNGLSNTEVPCFRTWERNRPCDNCISFRAMQEKRQVVKLEYYEGTVFFIIAVPVKVAGQDRVLELIKDVSDSIVVSNKTKLEENRLSSLISSMNRMPVIDANTELFNQFYVQKQIPEDVTYCKRENSPMVAVLVDIDDLTTINELYGHALGDLVIFRISQLVRKHLMPADGWAARFEGDSFLSVFYRKSADEVYAACRQFQNAVDELYVYTSGEPLHVKVSMGICELDLEADTSDSFLANLKNKTLAATKSKNLKITY